MNLHNTWQGSLRLRQTVGLSVVILTIMTVGSFVMLYEQGTTIRQAAEARGLAFSRTFALVGAAAVLDNLFRIQEAMNQILQDPDILEIDVIDPDNMIVAAKNTKRIGTVLHEEEWIGPPRSQREVITYVRGEKGEPLLVIVEPLLNQGKIAAWTRIVFSLSHVRHAELQSIQRMTLVTIALILAGIVGVHVAQRRVSSVFRRIVNQLQEAVKTLGLSQQQSLPRPGQAPVVEKPALPRSAQGEFEYLTSVVTETADLLRKQSEVVHESELKYRSVAQSANDAIISADSHGVILSWNKGAKDIFGYAEEEVWGKPMTLLMSERYREAHQEGLKQMQATGEWERIGTTVELHGLRKDGSEFPLELSLATWKTSEEIFYSAIIRDITERKQAEARLAELAYYDFLTGLPNRRQFMELLDQALGRARRTGTLVAILFLDLDGFKLVNDSLGHPMGDLVLKTMATRLTGCVRKTDSVARMGGDEFMFILEKISSPNDASAVAQKLLETVALPLKLEGHDIFMTASIGIVIYPSDDQDRDGLIQYADTAMYAAKAKSNSFQFYSADMNVRAADRLQLETDLRRAVERDELLPHYQPLIDAHSGNICGVEALVRWKHPQRGLLPPASFISVAEETGLIVPITELMLRTACAQIKAWQDGGFPDLRSSVNISRRLFQYHNLSDMIVQILQETGLKPSSLEVELTEGIFIQDRERSIATLQKLRDVGVRIAIDDFGVEYSSLGYLKHLPITTLKIDQSFVRDLSTNPADAAIIQAIISMASCLDLTVIAEGVETNAQAEFLRNLLCDELQGFYFSRPLPANLLTQLLGHPVFRPAGSRITLGSPDES